MTALIRFFAFAPLFVIPFLPLYSEGSLFFPFIAGKGFAFRLLVEIAAGAWLLLALSEKKYRPKNSWTLLIYGALVVWMFIADLFAVNPHKAFWSNYERMDGFVTLVHVFLFFVVASSVLSVGNLFKKWWLTVIGASVFVAMHGVLQLLGKAEIHQGGVRLDANLGNAAYLAAYLLFIIAITTWQAFEHKGWWRYGLFALAGVHTILLFATATRGAILGFVGAIVLGAILWAIQSGKSGRKVAGGIIAGVLVLTGGFLVLRDSDFIRNDPAFGRLASISVNDGSTRFTLWGMATKGVMERPVFGWGHEGFSYIFTKYYEPSLYAQEPWFDRAHSVFIDWLVYGGVPALLLFLALLVSGVVNLFRAPITKLERVMLISAMAAYAFQALFVFDNLMSYIMLAAILAVAHAGVAKPFARLEKTPELSASALASTALPAVIVLTLGVMWLVNIPGIMGGQALIRALGSRQDVSISLENYKKSIDSGTFATQEVREQLIGYAGMVATAPTVSNEGKASIVEYAVAQMEEEIRRVPEDARLKIMYAQTREAVGDLQGALTLLTQAQELSPKKQTIILQMGLEVWKMGDRARANELFAQAYELNTNNKEAALYASAGRMITGDTANGLELLRQTFGTTTVNDNILRFAFVEAKLYPELIASAYANVLESKGSADSRLFYARALATAGKMSEARGEIEAIKVAFPEAKSVADELLKQLLAQ